MAPADTTTPHALLQQWLARRVDAAGTAWMGEQLARLAGGGSDRDLFLAVSLASRKLGKAALALDANEQAQAERARHHWQPAGWTVDQAARVLLLLAAGGDAQQFSKRLDQLCATADVDELVAFYRGLPLYPDPPRHRQRAAEGLRSNMKVVFEAVAHANPYPAEQLDDEAWNQMVLKAHFVGSAFHPIVGLDDRVNEKLARMLCDHAHERWAAHRPVSPEVWRCVGPVAQGPLLADLQRVLAQGEPAERAAAVLALRSAPDPAARALLQPHAALCDAVAARGIDWTTVVDYT
ncbi:hypothetical protein BurJ1DRAFT_1464 [Burkholderiales bacterium JOSHI_001]|nr:hypothetical protein BurJ1DRAFT_1464 [Burkholderiales bacterium JOSHI_001]